VVGVPPELAAEAVQTFQSPATSNGWPIGLLSIGIKTVAMESTGVY